MSMNRKVTFYGRVQGVWFRGFVKQSAQQLGVVGWVRNCSDGSVEAVLCGSDEAIDELLNRCRKGPPLARVDRVVSDNYSDSALFEDFQIRYE